MHKDLTVSWLQCVSKNNRSTMSLRAIIDASDSLEFKEDKTRRGWGWGWGCKLNCVAPFAKGSTRDAYKRSTRDAYRGNFDKHEGSQP